MQALSEAMGVDPAENEARTTARECATLFNGLVFFIQRECPRDLMAGTTMCGISWLSFHV